MARQTSMYLLLLLLLSACTKPKLETAFYFWKTQYELSPFERNYLIKNKVHKIYIRYFDIEGRLPHDVLIWKQAALKDIVYIPVVFIDNQSLVDLRQNEIEPLAANVVKLCRQISHSQKLMLNEIQIDCDWTKSTKNNYFALLEQIKSQGLIVSSTLRLYQYKYREQSGVPPVDYLSLMCYNMGNLKENHTNNSIINDSDLQAYLNASNYPKPINIAMPIFNWILLFKGEKFKGILYRSPNLAFKNWRKVGENKYICTQDYFDEISAYYYNKNDEIKIEKITPNEFNKYRNFITKRLQHQAHEIIYFDLDSTNLANYLFATE